MNPTTRTAALGVFAALMLAIGSPRDAAAHEGGDGTFHVPEPPQNLRVTGIAGTRHNAIVASWDAGHDHSSPFHVHSYQVFITDTARGECGSRKGLRGCLLPRSYTVGRTGGSNMRIPVKPITRSGLKPITDSGQADHQSERSDAGR